MGCHLRHDNYSKVKEMSLSISLWEVDDFLSAGPSSLLYIPDTGGYSYHIQEDTHIIS